MLPMPNLNDLSDAIHAENMKWWVDLETGEPIETPAGQKEMLMISEVAEAMEGLRKDLMDDKLPHRKMAEVEAADYVIRVLDYAAAHKCTLFNPNGYGYSEVGETDAELMLGMCGAALALYDTMDEYKEDPSDLNHDELCTCVTDCIRWASTFCHRFGYDLWQAVEEKRAYNRERADHKVENRKLEGGKKW